MTTNTYDNALIISTLTDEAAASSLHNMHSDAIVAFIDFVGGEEAFADALDEAKICVNGSNMPAVDDNEAVSELYHAHKDEIILFCKNSTYFSDKNTMVEDIAQRVNSQGNDFSLDEIAMGLYADKPANHDQKEATYAAQRCAVIVVLQDLFSTYDEMRLEEE